MLEAGISFRTLSQPPARLPEATDRARKEGVDSRHGGRPVDGWANIRGYAGSRLSTNP